MQKIRKSQYIHNNQTMIVAVDLGKDKNYARFRNLEGIDSKPFEFSNCRAGYDKFLMQIRRHKMMYGAKHVVVGFESTGSYGVPLAHLLDKNGITSYMVNPVHTHRLKQMRDNSPNKHDKKDPQVVADIVQLGCTLSVIIPKGAAAELRGLVHARERAIETIKTCHNRMHELVFQTFPEFNQHIKDLLSKTALYLLEHYTLPEQLACLSQEELCALLHKISRGRFSSAKAAALLEVARRHGGVSEGTSVLAMEIQHQIRMIKQLQAFVAELETEIKNTLKKMPAARQIMSLKGVGAVTAAAMLGETAEFIGFNCAAEVEKLAGLNLFEISSGRHQGQRRISKRGRSLLRKVLFFAALNVVKKRGVYHQQYQDYLKRGMAKNKALIAISRKLVRVIFALVRDNAEFDASYAASQLHKKAA